MTGAQYGEAIKRRIDAVRGYVAAWLDGTLAFDEAAALLVPFDEIPLKAEEAVPSEY